MFFTNWKRKHHHVNRSKVVQNLQGDRVIWTIVLLFAALSVIAVYSSTNLLAYKEKGGDTEFYLLKHGFFIFGGLLITYLCYLLPYQVFGKMARMLMMITIPLLLYTLVFGVDVNNARRWITIPIISLTFQASDLAKLALVVYLARELARRQDQIKDFQASFLPILIPVILVCVLIAPANLSTAMMLFATSILLMIVGRVRIKHILGLVGAGILAFGVILLIGIAFPDLTRSGTWIARVQEFLFDSDGGYQLQQAKIAIAKGGLFGEGPGNSIQRNFLPSPYADFIYAIIIEEFGLFGGAFLLGLYVILFIRSVRLVTLCEGAFGALLTMGMSLLIVLQALANMAVSVHLVPVTGLTLPLISMGGTSLLFFSMSAGMILSVSRQVEQQRVMPEPQIATA
ncbi:MAG: FtsW/RodA/SpoVE family cell cycle protein [Saprospiraceae bacterium]|nr:FtsW/RodA/SpoVE family cell cycle protein [Saprospiraceae bacterium]